jgi:menaquinone-dependent protoporphyrinogen IX oxidase
MRIAVVSVSAGQGEIGDYVRSLARGMESMGHRVDILDARKEDGFRLPSYEYIAVCAEASSGWGGKMPDALPKILSSGSNLAGKKSAAFLKKRNPFFVNRSFSNLMKAMEKEGMLINWSDIILNASQAEALGRRIGA